MQAAPWLCLTGIVADSPRLAADIAANVAQVRERIAAAARAAGRDPGEITLMAVSKTFPAAVIRAAYDAGVRLFGENYVQEFEEKSEGMGTAALLGPDAAIHMIGHLQSNKAAKACELFDGVDSVDSLKLARRLNAAVAAQGSWAKPLPVLLEINLGGEETKSGLEPESPELEALLAAAPELEHLRIRGLMAIPPWSEDPEHSRPYFRRLRALRDKLRDTMAARHSTGVSLDVLSMGMSGDFEVAIAEGSTCVRVGTAIFGRRKRPSALEGE